MDMEADSFNLNRSLRTIFLIPLIAVILLISILSWQIFQLVDANSLLTKTHQIISQMEFVQRLIIDAETGLRGYLLNRDEIFLEPYNKAKTRVPTSVVQLKTLIIDESQKKRVDLIYEQYDQWLAFSYGLLDLQKRGQYESVINISKTARGKKIMDTIRSRVNQFQEYERMLIDRRSELKDKALNATLISAAFLGLLTIIFIGVSGKRRFSHLVGVFKMALDERRKAEDVLLVMNKGLEAFSYSVSHDLRAPLRTMDGFSQLVLEKYGNNLDQKGKDYLCHIRAASQDMARLIDDLLTLAQVSRSDLNPDWFIPGQLVRSILEEYKKNDPTREIVFEVDSVTKIKADYNLAKIALTNLIDNAWKYSSKKDITHISFHFQEKTPEFGSVFFIRDQGAGFEMSHYAQLFKPFQRLHAAREFSGTGIGLATVKSIIDRHGGMIRAESVPGTGTTFYFSFGNTN